MIGHGFALKTWNSFRVQFTMTSKPRVARKTGQPWALELNAFGVMNVEAILTCRPGRGGLNYGFHGGCVENVD